MSLHVYIANQGLKDNPIASDAWIAAARQHHALTVLELRSRNGSPYHEVHLKKDKASRLTLDRYGLVHAQAPSRDLIVVMFDLAATLGAMVVSEKAKPYRSVDDWEKRTREFRKRHEDNKARHRTVRRRWIAFSFALLIPILVALVIAIRRDF
jgi:hypothetical protein